MSLRSAPPDRFWGGRVGVALDPQQVRLTASVRTLVDHRLSFRVVEGTWSAPRRRPDRALIVLEFDVPSVKAAPERVAEIARSPDFLDASAFPRGKMVLRVLGRRSASDPFKHQLLLELALKGRLGRVLVPADLRRVGCEVRLATSLVIDRRKFGVGKPGTRLDSLVRSSVKVELQVAAPAERFGVGCAQPQSVSAL